MLPLSSISPTFATGMNQVHIFNSLLVFIDRFTKIAIFVPTHKLLNASDYADLIINQIICPMGFLRR